MCNPGLRSQETHFLTLDDPVELENGHLLEEITVAFRTWGTLNQARDNAVLVCHALTGSADADRWWPGLFGPGKTLDPNRDFVICSNVLGSCYGTTGPASLRPDGGTSYGPDFPDVTVRDMVHVQRRLLDALGIWRLQMVIGGSLGGMQTLEWAASCPERVGAAVVVATSGRHSPWCIAQSEAQRAAIRADAAWNEGWYSPARPPARGLAAARMMAMCTYRTPGNFGDRFGRGVDTKGDFLSESYLRHHGNKLVGRFDANAYIVLTRAMDSHDLGRGRGPYPDILGSISSPVLVVAISSDLLYPPVEQYELAQWIPRAHLMELQSNHGHDGFLIDTEELNFHIGAFRAAQIPCRVLREVENASA